MKLTYRETAGLRLLGAEYVYSGERPNLDIATVMAHNRVTGDDVPVVAAHIYEGMLEAAQKREALAVAQSRAADFRKKKLAAAREKNETRRRSPITSSTTHEYLGEMFQIDRYSSGAYGFSVFPDPKNSPNTYLSSGPEYETAEKAERCARATIAAAMNP